MRLQLALAACAIVAAPARPAHADTEASARVAVYADSDATTVITSSVAARGEIGEHLAIDAQYLVDAVSSASVDVITAATGRIHDVRHEVTAGATWRERESSLRAGYTESREHDWTSHTGRLAVAHDLLDRNLTLGLDTTLGFDSIGRVGGTPFAERLLTLGAEVYATYTASPRDLVSIGYGLSWLDGYQGSPYRFVVHGDLRAVREAMPAHRLRQTVTARWNRHLFDDSALRSELRAYRDSWAVASLTARLEYVVGFGALDLGVRVRGYAQRHARFYRPAYPTMMTYMTSDRELSSFVDGFAGAAVSYVHELGGRSLRCELSVDAFAFSFAEFPAMTRRTGSVAALGVTLGP